MFLSILFAEVAEIIRKQMLNFCGSSFFKQLCRKINIALVKLLKIESVIGAGVKVLAREFIFMFAGQISSLKYSFLRKFSKVRERIAGNEGILD